HRIGAAGGRDQPSLLALHGHAGVVGHLLAAAGQLVEQRGLAAVGVAQQGQAQGGVVHAPASCGRPTRTRAASARRRAKRVKPTCTSSGSAPNGPRATISTGSPATKPSSRRRRATGSFGLRSSTDWTTTGVRGGRSDSVTADS